MSRLVLASGNAGKLAEMRELLGDLDFQLIAQSELGIADADETGATFIENALIKARHAARLGGGPALADDSGLIVDALGGRPGLNSARYAGTHGNAEANIDKLLGEMTALPEARRGARFYCVVVRLMHAEDPAPLIAEGVWEGRILFERRGQGGFGYDPVFFDPTLEMSAAELDAASKNRVSHRGQALVALRARLQCRP